MSQSGELFRGLEVGAGVFQHAGQAQVGDDEGVGQVVVGHHVIGLDAGQADSLAVFLDREVFHTAGQFVECGRTGRAHDHHRIPVGGDGPAADIDGDDLAPLGEQGDLTAGVEGGVGAGIALPVALAGGVDGGTAGDGVLLAVGAFQIGGLGVGGQGDGGGGAVVGDEADDFLLVVGHQGAPAALKAGGGHVVRLGQIGPVRGADGPTGHAAVLRLHVHRQHHHVALGAAQALIVVAALAGLAGQGVDEQLGGLGAGDGAVGPGAHPVGQADGGGQVQIALRPHCPHLLGLIAQHPDEDGGRLGQTDLGIRVKAAVAHAGDEGRSGGAGVPAAVGGAGAAAARHRQAGGQVHIAQGPVPAGHVGEDGPGGVHGHLVPLLQKFHHHGAKLRPGQVGAGVEAVAAHSVHHAHQPQHVGVDGGVPVRHVGKGRAARRPGGNGQGKGQRRRQGQRKHTLFFHK